MGLKNPSPSADDFDHFDDFDSSIEGDRGTPSHRRSDTKLSVPGIGWVIRGHQLRVKNVVYDLRQAVAYGYEPVKLTHDNRQDRAQTAYLCYRFPVPGAKRYFVDPADTGGTLRPLQTQHQLQSIPPEQVVWVVVFGDEVGQAVRKLFRDYLRSLR